MAESKSLPTERPAGTFSKIIPIFAIPTHTPMAEQTKPKRGRGRPRKDPNDTTTAQYVKHAYDTTGKVGRPKKNPYEGTGWGGVRDGAGRPPQLKPSERKSATVIFMATPATKRRYELLKEAGYDPADLLRRYLDRIAATKLGTSNVPDNWTPPKSKS